MSLHFQTFRGAIASAGPARETGAWTPSTQEEQHPGHARI